MVEFLNAMQEAGIQPPVNVVADGILHRFSVGEERQKSGWYVLHEDPLAGSFGCWKTGVNQKWSRRTEFTKEEKIAFKKKIEADKKERAERDRTRKTDCREKAAATWGASEKISSNGYIDRKGIIGYGVRYHLDSVVVPVLDSKGTLHGLQFIRQDGTKRFLPGTAKKGCYFSMGNVQDALCICEGYATGASIHECTGLPVAVAFDAGNIINVAKALREKLTDVKIIICADNDEVGIEKALEATASFADAMAVPEFKGMDFNDLHSAYGKESVAETIGYYLT